MSFSYCYIRPHLTASIIDISLRNVTRSSRWLTQESLNDTGTCKILFLLYLALKFLLFLISDMIHYSWYMNTRVIYHRVDRTVL